jgi:hypothetical protein
MAGGDGAKVPPAHCPAVSEGRPDVTDVAPRQRLKQGWHDVRRVSAMLAPAQAALLRGSQDIALLRGSQDIALLRGSQHFSAAPPVTAVARAAPPAASSPAAQADTQPLREGELAPMQGSITFGDFLSGLNPLQHLPIVGTIYRAATGDVAPAAMRVAGGFLMGGPLGAVASAVGVMVEAMMADARPRMAEAWDAQHGSGAADRAETLRAASAAYGAHPLGLPGATA